MSSDNVNFAFIEIVHSDDKSLIGMTISLEKSTTMVGRSASNDVILPDSSVSRFHAKIERSGNSYLLYEVRDELGKSPANGTSVNGLLVRGTYDLKDGDVIHLGKHTELRFWHSYGWDALSTSDPYEVDSIHPPHLAGDPTIDAPPPPDVSKKKGRGQK